MSTSPVETASLPWTSVTDVPHPLRSKRRWFYKAGKSIGCVDFATAKDNSITHWCWAEPELPHVVLQEGDIVRIDGERVLETVYERGGVLQTESYYVNQAENMVLVCRPSDHHTWVPYSERHGRAGWVVDFKNDEEFMFFGKGDEPSLAWDLFLPFPPVPSRDQRGGIRS